jgi:predicted DNA-binding transcriptional regulator AlpA
MQGQTLRTRTVEPMTTPQTETAVSDRRQGLNEACSLKKVLRPAEAALYTGLAESTLAKRRLKGLPPQYLSLGGRAIGYDISVLDQWLESCRRRSTSEVPSG